MRGPGYALNFSLPLPYLSFSPIRGQEDANAEVHTQADRDHDSHVILSLQSRLRSFNCRPGTTLTSYVAGLRRMGDNVDETEIEAAPAGVGSAGQMCSVL